MFVSRRLYKAGDGGLARDLICTGCQLCGSPLELDSENVFKQNAVALYCSESLNHLHLISSRYSYLCGTKLIMHRSWSETRPQSSCSENIGAERVCSYYKGKKQAGQVDSKDVPTQTSLNAKAAWQPKAAEGGVLVSCSADRDKKSSESKGKTLLKTMLQQGKNSPLKFEVNANAGLDKENGRFEMVSVQLPCFKTK